MQTILGPFHPFLENALVDQTLSFKRAELMSPLLILVPSDALRRRVKILLSRERRLALLNVQLLTFYQLSLQLYRESGAEPPELRDDLFLEEALRQIIRTRQPGAEPFAGIEERVGGCAALWQTLRDLRDGLVTPEDALAALSEGHLGKRPSERPAQLLRLLKSFAGFCEDHGIYTLAEIDKAAIKQIPASKFLQRFTQIMYYCFYDLTQIQVDLFHAVARNFPTTVFFPLLQLNPPHGGWSFAERFYERYVHGRSAGTTTNLASSASLPATFRLFDEDHERIYSPAPENWRCTVSSAFGIHDEVSAAAKEVLRLVDDESVSFHEIAVVARSLEGYGPTIQEIFQQHRIPLAGRLEEPLAQFPLTKAVILLLHLPAKDFPRGQVIDFLSSPYLKAKVLLKENIEPRPDLWDLATRELAICKGLPEWRRLRKFGSRELELAQGSEDQQRPVTRIAPAQLIYLADLVETLAADLSKLPRQASWNRFAAAWKELLSKYLGMAPPDAEPLEAGSEAPINETIFNVLHQLSALDAVGQHVTLADFSHTFQHWLERSTISRDRRNVGGVLVLNATAARGVACRAMFILGMNEGVFPRTIREDAFMRDRDREILELDLGYKINQKLAAFDEEKLLFNLLVNAARERLYCSFQRADESGRALAPSWYLSELRRALGTAAGEQIRQTAIPRSASEKSALEIFAREDLLLPEELAIRLSFNAEDPTPLVEASGLAPVLYKHGRKAVARLDRSTERLHEFDGMLGPSPEHWQRFAEQGISPTALETYATCPFQFFARHVLRLERLDLPEESSAPSAAEFGELGHEILKGCYQDLIDSGYFKGRSKERDIVATVRAVAQRAFAKYELAHPVGYPLAWEHTKEGLTELIQQFVMDDLREISVSGYIPVALETDRLELFPTDWPEPLKNVKMHGRMDRIDYNRMENRLRVIDYKFKFSAQPSAQDKDLGRSALRGQKLQPLFYCILGKRSVGQDSHGAEPGAEAKFYYIAQRWRDGPLMRVSFDADAFAEALGSEIKKTVCSLATGIREGEFFMQRNDACPYCEVAEICRKNHPPSLWRTENDPVTAPHRALRDKDPDKL
jgi:ATP-dependent helicase/nuclease subunit B